MSTQKSLRDEIDRANSEAVEKMVESDPVWTDIGIARNVMQGVKDDTLMHAGPPIEWERMSGPMRGAVIGAIIYEGLADDEDRAVRLAQTGEIVFKCNNDVSAVAPMAGVISPRMPVIIVRDRKYGNTCYSNLNEGIGRVLRYGAYDKSVIDRLVWMRDFLTDCLQAALREVASEKEGIFLKSIVSQALHMGDECVTASHLICTEEGGVETIKKVREGSKIVGGSVTAPFSRATSVVRKIRTSFGYLWCTPTHPCLVITKERVKHSGLCISDDPEVKEAKDVKLGDLMLIPEQLPHVTETGWTPDHLGLLALVLCDGHIEFVRKRYYNVKISVRKDREWVKDVYERGIKAFLPLVIRDSTNSRGDYTLSFGPDKLGRILVYKFGVPYGKKSHKVDISDEVFHAPIESIRRFIDVCFCCEGWVFSGKNGKSSYLAMATTSYNLALKMQLLLKKFGVHTNLVIKKRKNPQHRPAYHIVVTGPDVAVFREKIGLSLPRKEELLKRCGNASRRKYDTFEYQGRHYVLARVLDNKPMSYLCKVYDFTTSSGTFVANGHLTHNCHNRHVAATSLFLRELTPYMFRSGMDKKTLLECFSFMNQNSFTFLGFAMAAAKLMTLAAHNVKYSTIVTVMTRNGTDAGIRVSGLGNQWFTAPSPVPRGVWFPGYSEQDANPDLGDSSITETAGFGAFAMASAPAIVSWVGGSVNFAVENTNRMYEITHTKHKYFTIPYFEFQGTPTGIDIRKVVKTGIAPTINTGIAHRDSGVGQVGAGIVTFPMELFKKALKGYAESYSV